MRTDPDVLYGSVADLKSYLTDPEVISTIKNNGTDPTVVSGRLDALDTDLLAKRDVRDKAKSKHEIAQRDFALSADAHYDEFSNIVDTVSGALGKKTTAGKQVLAYRKHVTGNDRHNSTTTTTTTPPTPPSP